MPSGVYIRTEEHKQKLRQSMTPKVREKIRQSRLGKHHSEETKEKMRKNYKPPSREGTHHSEETKEKMSINSGMKRPEVKAKFCGENNHNWNGGTSFEPYCFKFNNELKKKIRDRDNRKCQNCGKTKKENGRELAIHHIHYDKPNCNPDLITLCHECNTKANTNRDYWEEYYMAKLNGISNPQMRFL